MLNAVMPYVVMLSVIILSVVASFKSPGHLVHSIYYYICENTLGYLHPQYLKGILLSIPANIRLGCKYATVFYQLVTNWGCINKTLFSL